MVKWLVKPTMKKSIVEVNYFVKGDETVFVETVWRWGEFYVYTDDDNVPDIFPGIDIYNCDYETELIHTTDGCFEEVNYDSCGEETKKWLDEFFEKGHRYYELEDNGWQPVDSEMYINCAPEVEKIEDEVV